jgi:hypothetical protein
VHKPWEFGHKVRFGEAFKAGAMDRGYYDGEKIGVLMEIRKKPGVRRKLALSNG